MSNIVLVTVDSLRADHLGAYGYDRDTSPVIDDMADGGLSFDAYANSHWTRASFPSIITSTYPLEYGGFEYLSDSRVTVGEAMQAAGHRTAAFHSNLWLSRDYNYDRGFDHFYDSKSEPSLLSRLRTFVKLRLDEDGVVYRALQWLYDTTEEKAGVDVGQTYRDAETITDRAIEWLDGVDGEDDVFLWVHYMDVHHPYVPHERAADELGLDLDLSEREAVKLRRKMLEDPDDLTDGEFQQLVDLYDAEIRYTDRHVGRLRDAVGLDDTAFVVTGDHGEEFGDHGGFSHNPSFYDEVLHVPFVVDGAGRVDATAETGFQSEELELLDTAPTVCDLAAPTRPRTTAAAPPSTPSIPARTQISTRRPGRATTTNSAGAPTAGNSSGTATSTRRNSTTSTPTPARPRTSSTTNPPWPTSTSSPSATTSPRCGRPTRTSPRSRWMPTPRNAWRTSAIWSDAGPLVPLTGRTTHGSSVR
jgi:arylsulfatase A-like enzyme